MTQPAVDPIVKRKLSDEVFDRLRQMILDGQLTPGDPVPSERALMERFGVGRPAVREALQTMHLHGLITVSHGERSRVNALGPDVAVRQVDPVARFLLSLQPENLGHLKEARKLFEIGMVKLAAEKRTDQDIADLRRLLAEQTAASETDEAFVQGDMRFHNKIAQISDNPLMSSMGEAMLGWLFAYHTPVLHWSGREQTTLSEHAGIIDAIEARDPEVAARRMSDHLDRTAEQYQHHR